MKADIPAMHRPTWLRIGASIALLVAFAVFVGDRLFPSTPWFVVVAGACAGAVVAVAVLAVIAGCAVAVRRFVLDQGGTDAQWLWFGREPDGLRRLREAERRGQGDDAT